VTWNYLWREPRVYVNYVSTDTYINTYINPDTRMGSTRPTSQTIVPLPSIIDSQQNLFKLINIWAATGGYAFITPEMNGFLTVIYVCDWSYHPSNLSREWQRRTTTRYPLAQTQVIWHKAPSQCTKCHAIGHTRTSRACPLHYSCNDWSFGWVTLTSLAL